MQKKLKRFGQCRQVLHTCHHQKPRHLNISRNARSKGIDNCCGLYIRVYFRKTPIENERRFMNLIVN